MAPTPSVSLLFVILVTLVTAGITSVDAYAQASDLLSIVSQYEKPCKDGQGPLCLGVLPAVVENGGATAQSAGSMVASNPVESLILASSAALGGALVAGSAAIVGAIVGNNNNNGDDNGANSTDTNTTTTTNMTSSINFPIATQPPYVAVAEPLQRRALLRGTAP